jgi:hypothetical protein
LLHGPYPFAARAAVFHLRVYLEHPKSLCGAPAEDRDRDHPDEDHAGVEVLLGDVEDPAEAVERADEFGRDQRRPGGLQRQA